MFNWIVNLYKSSLSVSDFLFTLVLLLFLGLIGIGIGIGICIAYPVLFLLPILYFLSSE